MPPMMKLFCRPGKRAFEACKHKPGFFTPSCAALRAQQSQVTPKVHTWVTYPLMVLVVASALSQP